MFSTSAKSGFRLALVVASLMICSGCHPWALWKHRGLEQLPIATADHPVYEVICLWEPGEGTGLDGLPARGFIGQIMFFARGISPPVRINGDVRIYVFDDQGTQEEQQHPIHQFDFSQEAFQTFLTEANLGATYRLFIPYTKKGTHRANCAVRVRLTPKDGMPVYSKMGSLILPGPITKPVNRSINEEIANALTKGGVQQASHEVPVKEDAVPVQSMTVPTAQAQTDVSADRARLFSVLNEVTRTSASATASPSAEVPQAEHPIQREVKVAAVQPTESAAPKSVETAKPAPNPIAEPAPATGTRLKLAPAAGHPLSGEKESAGGNKPAAERAKSESTPEAAAKGNGAAAQATAAELFEADAEPAAPSDAPAKAESKESSDSPPPAAAAHPLADLE